ncbi:vWA domain-containing protein [Pseudomonas sp. PSKL.D1]|uniref:vWA domain-containing protein n=1 Tax=Pseudomonas sp. PSKL.D1 TaxID=3029060 RepID=UPI0023816B79|nr:VWA domain-containing protein [Pseudomonas sp. PSKL.D1]WDY60321.1 VWA domain-containing protein [Pseudomonas sp. PSKL.D1]
MPRAGKLTGNRSGRTRKAASGKVAWLPTLLKGRPKGREDLRWQQRQGQPPALWLVIVDASASTRRHQALAETKGLLGELFDLAYRQRARLALMTASGAAPRWQRHGLKASAALQPWLHALGAGGGTPLLAGIEQARCWLQARQKAHPQEPQRCLVFTDGRLQRWNAVAPLPCATLLVDMELAPVRIGRARQLAEQLGAEYQHLQQFKLKQ